MAQRTIKLRILFIFSFLLFTCLSMTAQNVKIELKAPDQVQADASFRIQYIVESNEKIEKELELELKDGFEILSEPHISQNMSTIVKEGKRTVKYANTYSYLMRATRSGNYTFPRAKISLSGKSYKSAAAKIQVDGTTEKKKKTKTKEIKAFVRTMTSKTSVNLSDTLTLTYTLYSTEEPSRLIDFDFPATRDFYTTNITSGQQEFREEIVDKTKYWVIDLRVQLMQPREVGLKTIPEGQIEIEFATPTGRRTKNMWGEEYEEVERERKTLLIKSVSIQVQDLIAI